jgi:type II secretory pathway component PulF
MKPVQLTLEDVQYLSSEIRALTQARLPLEKHLADAGRGHGRRVQVISQEISDQLQRGEAVENIVDSHQSGAPRMLAATLAAGVLSGDMATSIELLGDLAADLVDARTRLTRAMAYPLVICVIAGALFLFAIRIFLRQVFETLLDLGADISPILYWIDAYDARYPHWPWICPAVLLAVVLIWLISGRASRMAFRGPERVLLLIPGVRSLVRDLQFYTLTRMVGLLIQRQLTLPDALMLAGNCVGDRGLETACHAEANTIRRGVSEPPPVDNWKHGQMPPLLQACVAYPAASDSELVERLGGVAGHYRRRVGLNLAWLQHVIPGTLLVLFGGGAVFIYGLSLMWPVSELYRSLTAF